MRLQLNRPLSTFRLVLSILAIIVGIAFVQAGSLWLTRSSAPPFVMAVATVIAVVAAVVVVVVVAGLRATVKRP